MKKLFLLTLLLQLFAHAHAYAAVNEDANPVELCQILPATGIYDALPTEWTITYGGKTLSVKEDAAITTPGDWIVSIPAKAISIEGTPVSDPQSFKYTLRNAIPKLYFDYTITPINTAIDTDAIDTARTLDGSIYNLTGQKVAKTRKGHYIVNVKKMVTQLSQVE